MRGWFLRDESMRCFVEKWNEIKRKKNNKNSWLPLVPSGSPVVKYANIDITKKNCSSLGGSPYSDIVLWGGRAGIPILHVL